MPRVRRAILSALASLLCPPPASTCSLAPPAIWAKHPKSSSALFRVVAGGKAGYIDRTGKLVIAARFDPAYFDPSGGDFHDGRALVSTAGGSRFIDESGQEMNLGPASPRAPFSNGLALAHAARNSQDSNLHLVVDRSGHILSSVVAYWLEPFSEGLAAFARVGLPDPRPGGRFGHHRGYMRPDGSVAVPPQFAAARPFSEGLAAVALDGSCWVEGRFPAPSARVLLTSCGPQAAPSVTAPCRHGYIDKSGRFVIPAKFELAREFSEGRAAVRSAGKWGFVDARGQWAVPARFDEVEPFSEGLAAVRLNGKWGYIERFGGEAIPFRFDQASPFSAGMAAVKSNGQHYYIGNTGDIVIPGPFLQATAFVQGLAHVEIEKSKWAWIETTGRAVFTYNWEPGR